MGPIVLGRPNLLQIPNKGTRYEETQNKEADHPGFHRRLRFSSSSSVWSASAVQPTPSQPPQKKSFVGSGRTESGEEPKREAAMGGGRKNLMRAVEEKILTLQQGHSIMQVLDLRGSNLIEVMDAKGHKSLAIFPAKFQKSMWIKRGNFVVVDESGREEAAEVGRKVGCVVVQVLFHEQVRVLQKSPEWCVLWK